MSALPKELLEACDALASEWVYAVHAWQGRSPEFMQTQKKRLGETIAQFVYAREQAVWREAVNEAAELARRELRLWISLVAKQVAERILADASPPSEQPDEPEECERQ